MKKEVLHKPATEDSNNPTLLLIHGSYCAASVWTEHYLPFFAAPGYPCAAISLRGHGQSPGNLAFASFADYVTDVAGVAASLGPTSGIRLAGWSPSMWPRPGARSAAW